jgi:multiple sugar transport system permease protein
MLTPRRKKKVWQGIFFVLILIVLIIFSFPLFWIILTGFKIKLDAFRMPPLWFFTPTLENFREVFLGEVARGVSFAKVYMNSIIVAVSSTLIPLILATLAAYSFARFNFIGKDQLAIFVIGTRMLPPIAIVIPIYLMFAGMKLIDTKLSLIVSYSGLNLPFAIWMLRGFFLQIPKELEESAMIDGCTRMGALWRIVLPLAAPGLVATAIFAFILAWNDFQFALVLATSNSITLPVAAARFRTDEGPLWGQIGAAAGLVLTPLLIVTFALQKHIVSGLTMGSVKG